MNHSIACRIYDIPKIAMNDMDNQKKLPEDEKIVFVPDEDIRAIESIYDKMEMARDELLKVAENCVAKCNPDSGNFVEQ